MLKEIKCAIAGHKWTKWKDIQGHSITGYFEYQFRECARCGATESINHIERSFNDVANDALEESDLETLVCLVNNEILSIEEFMVGKDEASMNGNRNRIARLDRIVDKLRTI